MAFEVKTDAQLQKDVLAELAWDPEVDPAAVGVAVTDGIVTLAGTVDSYAQCGAAERAALRVAGVRAVANELMVRTRECRTDTDIARAAADALAADFLIPRDRIRVTVADGWVTLEGEVDWAFQRREAEAVIQALAGITGLTNLVTIRQPAMAAAALKTGIKRALVRSAHVDAAEIAVFVADGRVKLTGTVSSWLERQAAEDAAWRSPGVLEVVNEIRVEPDRPRE